MNILEKFYFSKVGLFYFKLSDLASNHAFPLLILFVRIWMAQIFWYSGLTKISNMESTIYLFEYEYKFSLISYEIASYLAVFIELSMPILLVIGLCVRLAALTLLTMTAVIQLTYLNLDEHLYWACLLGVIALYGAGKFSLDHLLSSYRKKTYLDVDI